MPTARCKQCAGSFDYPPGIGKWTACCSEEGRAERKKNLAEAKRATWPTCSVKECSVRVRSGGADMCEKHYIRIYRNGTLKLTSPQRAQRGICTIDGCGQTDSGPHGYCPKHYSRKVRNGDPHLVLQPEPRYGPDNNLWRGDDAGYSAVHDRLRRWRGSATERNCVDCGRQAAHWSYNHDDPNEQFSPTCGAYSHDADCYSPRCVPCHKRFDLRRMPA